MVLQPLPGLQAAYSPTKMQGTPQA